MALTAEEKGVLDEMSKLLSKLNLVGVDTLNLDIMDKQRNGKVYRIHELASELAEACVNWEAIQAGRMKADLMI